MGVNLRKKYQDLVISKCGKIQNKVEVAEEIGCGNELSRVCKKLASKNEMSFY